MDKIARNNNILLDKLVDANPQIANPDRIQIGDKINLPEVSAAERAKEIINNAEDEPPDKVMTPCEQVGFYIVKKPCSRDDLISKLYNGYPSPDQKSFIEEINPHLGGQCKPGQQVILAKPQAKNIPEAQEEITELQEQAKKVDEIINRFDEKGQQELMDMFGVLAVKMCLDDPNSCLMTLGGAIFGTVEEYKRYIKGALERYEAMEKSFARKLANPGKSSKSELINQRTKFRRQFGKELSTKLSKIGLKHLGIPANQKLRTALRVSTKSLVHQAKHGGIKDIKGFPQKYELAAKHLKYLKGAGIAASVAGTAQTGYETYEICKMGYDKACERQVYTQVPKAAGAAAGGYGGAKAGGIAAGALCVAGGAVTGGAVWVGCILVGGLTGGLVGGYVGGNITENLGEKALNAKNGVKLDSSELHGEESLYMTE